jgi:cation-transporting ATPase E
VSEDLLQAGQVALDNEASERLWGLTERDVIERRERGDGNNVDISASRTYAEILKQNVFTFINNVLFLIGAIMIALGLYSDAFVSVGVIMLNVVVGVVQEFRAKRKLDQIALLTRPKATVIREGQEKSVDPSEIVLDDIIVVRAGDQIVVDGEVVGDSRMDLDESLLTGESDLILKQRGDDVFSGSFCVTGSGAYAATKVGADSFANKLTASAREFRVQLTPLQSDINFIVRILLMFAVIIGLLFGGAYAIRDISTIQTVQSAAVIAGLVPAGLILMTTTAYAMGALRMSGRGALIQVSNAVESISNVDVLCLDKTGTLTANRINLDSVFALNTTEDELRKVLGEYARSTRAGNRTSDALLEACDGHARNIFDEVAFSSARKWSAIAFDDPERQGVYVMGAPEMLTHFLPQDGDIAKAQMDAWAERGLRVLLMAYSPKTVILHDDDNQPVLPSDLKPLGVMSFSDELRPEAKRTLEGFIEAGIRLKIISGDNPHTVASLAKQAGLSTDIKVISGVQLSGMDETRFNEAAEEATIFGRITPEQKERLVSALRSQGHYVAMIGDGVNDVLSLKKAQIGVAMESGSAATRGVADIVLLNDSFAALPAAFMEGQRILNGMQNIIHLFLTRAFYAAIIILGTAVIVEANLFPFIPKHASLITLVTVGFPTFALAAWARPGIPNHNLTRSMIHFILPAALTLAAVALAVYTFYLSVYYLPSQTIAEEIKGVAISRTALTTSLVFMGLLLIPFVEPPTKSWVGGDDYSGDWRPTILAIIMLIIYLMIIFVDSFREFWELERLDLTDYLFLTSVAVLWGIIIRYIWRNDLFERFLNVQTKLKDRKNAPEI